MKDVAHSRFALSKPLIGNVFVCFKFDKFSFTLSERNFKFLSMPHLLYSITAPYREVASFFIEVQRDIALVYITEIHYIVGKTFTVFKTPDQEITVGFNIFERSEAIKL